MTKSNQVDIANLGTARDTLEGMSEEELQEGLRGLEDWDTHFNTSKHYAPRFGSKIAKKTNSIVKLVLLISGILIVSYCVTVFF